MSICVERDAIVWIYFGISNQQLSTEQPKMFCHARLDFVSKVMQSKSIEYFFFYVYSSYTVLLRCRGLDLFTFGRTPWTSDQPVARPLPKHRTTQTQNKSIHTHTHTHTPNIHNLSGIRTHDHSVRASEDSSCLRLLGYSDRCN
jgi:hypothetical protein